MLRSNLFVNGTEAHEQHRQWAVVVLIPLARRQRSRPLTDPCQSNAVVPWSMVVQQLSFNWVVAKCPTSHYHIESGSGMGAASGSAVHFSGAAHHRRLPAQSETECL